MGIKKETPLKLELSAAEVNSVLDGLAAMPYKQVAKLIALIHEQVRNQTQDSQNKTDLKGH